MANLSWVRLTCDLIKIHSQQLTEAVSRLVLHTRSIRGDDDRFDDPKASKPNRQTDRPT